MDLFILVFCAIFIGIGGYFIYGIYVSLIKKNPYEKREDRRKFDKQDKMVEKAKNDSNSDVRRESVKKSSDEFNIPDGYVLKDKQRHTESYGVINTYTYSSDESMYDIVISVSEFNSNALAKKFINYKFGLDENPHIVPNIYNGRKGYTFFSVFTVEFSYIEKNKVVTINTSKDLIEQVVPKP